MLGLSADAIGNYELDERTPNVATALGLEIIFGKALAAMLPDALYEVATKMIPRLQAFSLELEGRTDEVTQLKQHLINAIGDRLAHILPDA